jgi:hypothetical protein
MARSRHPNWGGYRPGAGRKPKGDVAGVAHQARPTFKKTLTVHVTLRFKPEVWDLRGRAHAAVEQALDAGADRFGTRILRHAVTENQIELLLEADDGDGLVRFCRGLSIRVAKSLNKLMGTRGQLLADRYETRVLRTPAEHRRARLAFKK